MVEVSYDQNLMALLDVLADGALHSGEELGQVLGVTRTAVWKHLQKLEEYGIDVESVRGKGYCLPGGLERLDAGRIRTSMEPHAAALLSVLDIFSVTDSTNARALSAGAVTGYVCLAEQQTAGRGRRGRAWVSPFGRNIYLSAAWQFEGGAASLEGLSLAVGVAIVQALEDCEVLGVQLKWPNDILWRGRKLGGILLEMTGDPSGICQVVVGVGLNVSMPQELAQAIDQPWADVRQIIPGISRNRLVSALLSRLLPMLESYRARGFSAYREAWQALDAFAGQDVILRTASQEIIGRSLGVDAAGALCLDIDGVEQQFHGGEISVRRV